MSSNITTLVGLGTELNKVIGTNLVRYAEMITTCKLDSLNTIVSTALFNSSKTTLRNTYLAEYEHLMLLATMITNSHEYNYLMDTLHNVVSIYDTSSDDLVVDEYLVYENMANESDRVLYVIILSLSVCEMMNGK